MVRDVSRVSYSRIVRVPLPVDTVYFGCPEALAVGRIGGIPQDLLLGMAPIGDILHTPHDQIVCHVVPIIIGVAARCRPNARAISQQWVGVHIRSATRLRLQKGIQKEKQH